MERGLAAPDDVELIKGAIGEFTITIDGRVAFNKADAHRFPTDQDIDGLA